MKPIEQEADERSEGTLILDLNLSNFNKPVSVEEPKNAKSFEELWEGIYSGALGNGAVEDYSIE